MRRVRLGDLGDKIARSVDHAKLGAEMPFTSPSRR
jgi:hypothetical protein